MDLYNDPDNKYYGKDVLKPEVEVKYDEKTKRRKYEINLIKNSALSTERNTISSAENNPYKSLYKNILFIYIDCISVNIF